MAAQNPLNLNPEHLSLYKEARNFIFDYSTHNTTYQKGLIDRLIKPREVYVLYPLKTIVFFLVKLSPPSELLFGAKPPFSYGKIHPFLKYFGGRDTYNRLNDIAEGKFQPFPDQKEIEIVEFSKAPEEEKDEKLNKEVSKKSGGMVIDFTPEKTTINEQPQTQKPKVSLPGLNIKNFKTPPFIKDIGVWTLVKTGNLINRHPKVSTPISVGGTVWLLMNAAGQGPYSLISGLLAAAGTGIAMEYLSAPRPQQQITEDGGWENEGERGVGGGGDSGSVNTGFNPRGVRSLGRFGKGARKAGAGARAAGGLTKAAIPLLANPVTWVVIGIIIFILLFFFLIFNKNASLFPPFGEFSATTATPSTQLKITKTAPGEVPNSSPIPYEITVTYTGTGNVDITVTDKVPDNTDFVSSNPATAPDANKILTWNLSKINPNQPQKLSFVVKPTKDDIYVQNNDYGATITSLTGGAGGGGGATADCTFYRDGDTSLSGGVSGLKFNIPEWPALINEVTSKIGVPASFIAGFLRVECPDCFATSDPSYITNDYDGHSSGVAYGAMQFTPNTFQEVFNNHKDELKDKFGITSFTLGIDPSDRNNPNSPVLRMYSIRDSVIAASFKARDDSGGVFDEVGIRKAVKAYYGSCIYDQGGQEWNYCSDVWKSVSSCNP